VTGVPVGRRCVMVVAHVVHFVGYSPLRIPTPAKARVLPRTYLLGELEVLLAILDGQARWPTCATDEALVDAGAVEARPPDRTVVVGPVDVI